jgi:hypothetical protein
VLSEQGDQIGRFLAHWAIVYFGPLVAKYRSSPNFWATFFRVKSYATIREKWFWLHFGRFLKQTRLATLFPTETESDEKNGDDGREAMEQ